MEIFDQRIPLETNHARLVHLASLGLDLREKTVLEVGAGFGHLTGFWEARCCKITSTDARTENIRENMFRHPWRSPVHADLRKRGDHELGQFNVVFAYGILYLVPADRLADIVAELASVTTRLLLASMIVQRRDMGTIEDLRDDPGRLDSSADGRRNRPARDWFMAELSKHFDHTYITRTQPDHKEFATNWPANQANPRCIFAASRCELDPQIFSHELLTRQERL